MTGIIVAIIAAFVMIAGPSASLGQGPTIPGPQHSGAFTVPIADRSLEQAGSQERSLAPPNPRFFMRMGRECPGYTKSRQARIQGNLALERLLARGVDDPLFQPAIIEAMRRENALAHEIEACNRDWVKVHSIYRGVVILLIGDEATRDLTSFLLTILGFEVIMPLGPATILADIGAATRAHKDIAAVVLDTGVATPDLTENVENILRSSAPRAALVSANPKPNDPLVRRYRRDGFAYALPQPYHPAMLWRAVNRITGSSGRKPL